MTKLPLVVIDYDSEGFAPGAPVPNGSGRLNTSWPDILRAALTVGRPNRQYVFKHGRASIYEALFRLSLVRMALEQRGPSGTRLRRTTAARTLDPSEKGAVNYFVGLTICKLFAETLLDAPWMLHLDVFRPTLNPTLTGRSRPDLVGQTASGEWVALECKGRISVPDAKAKDRAKDQAERLVSINGIAPAFQIGGIAFFKGEVLRFFWRDPQPQPERVSRPIEAVIRAGHWRYYYAPVLGLISERPDDFRRMQREPVLSPVPSADIEVGIHPAVLRALVADRWESPRVLTEGADLSGDVRYQADGLAIRAGTSWAQPFEEEGESRSRL